MKRTEIMSLYHPHPTSPIEGEGKLEVKVSKKARE
jgi:hypothetical protein